MICTNTIVSLCPDPYDSISIQKYNLNNGFLSVDIVTYGATITSIKMPNKEGLHEEVTLCYDTYEKLVNNPGPYYGCVAGRYANRIKNGKFHLLERAPGVSVEEIISKTEGDLVVPAFVPEMKL